MVLSRELNFSNLQAFLSSEAVARCMGVTQNKQALKCSRFQVIKQLMSVW